MVGSQRLGERKRSFNSVEQIPGTTKNSTVYWPTVGWRHGGLCVEARSFELLLIARRRGIYDGVKNVGCMYLPKRTVTKRLLD
jgi:hypothetical protein